MSSQAYSTRRQVGMIWPPPRWMASACITTSHTCAVAPGIVTCHPTQTPQNNEPYPENIFDSISTGLSFHRFRHAISDIQPLHVAKQEQTSP